MKGTGLIQPGNVLIPDNSCNCNGGVLSIVETPPQITMPKNILNIGTGGVMDWINANPGKSALLLLFIVWLLTRKNKK